MGQCGVIAGRSAARLHGLDGFQDDLVEILVPRQSRNLTSQSGTVRSTAIEIGKRDATALDGLRVLRPERHRRGINGGRVLLDALVDTGGESRLERMFLRLVRLGKLDQPTMQRTYRSGSTVIARVDFEFSGGLIVGVNGFGFHSTRQQLQRDAARQSELVLLGKRALTFTYDDVRHRPDWVLERVARGMSMGLAA